MFQWTLTAKHVINCKYHFENVITVKSSLPLGCHFSQVSSGFQSSVSSCTSVFWLWASYWCVSKWFASVPRGRWTPSRSTPSLPCALSSQVRMGDTLFWVDINLFDLVFSHTFLHCGKYQRGVDAEIMCVHMCICSFVLKWLLRQRVHNLNFVWSEQSLNLFFWVTDTFLSEDQNFLVLW